MTVLQAFAEYAKEERWVARGVWTDALFQVEMLWAQKHVCYHEEMAGAWRLEKSLTQSLCICHEEELRFLPHREDESLEVSKVSKWHCKEHHHCLKKPPWLVMCIGSKF